MISKLLIVLPVIGAVFWNILDCSPGLFFYDKIMTLTNPKIVASSLEGKTIWITGASSGIGASLVCQVMTAGAGHVILSSRKRDKLEQVASKCKEDTNAFTQLSIVPYDAASVDSTDAIVDSALAFAAGPGIDILILNAGIYQTQLAVKATRQEREYITRVNYQAPVELAQSLILRAGWKARGYGQIVAVSSIMGLGPHSLGSTYAASKAALKSYFHTLSTEEHAWLRVDVACPGATDTDLWKNSGNPDAQGTEASKMTADRVAHLILIGISGPYWMFYETWISKTAGLLYATLSHYTPTLFHVLIHILGHVRIAVFEHENLDIVDAKTVIEKLVLILLGRYP